MQYTPSLDTRRGFSLDSHVWFSAFLDIGKTHIYSAPVEFSSFVFPCIFRCLLDVCDEKTLGRPQNVHTRPLKLSKLMGARADFYLKMQMRKARFAVGVV